MEIMAVFFGITVSLDGFLAAVAYGARRIRLTALASALVSLASAFMLWLAMQVGQFFNYFLPVRGSRLLGAVLLLAVGIYLIYQEKSAVERPALARPLKEERLLAQLNLRAFGLIVQILQDPTTADRDRSGVITWQEAGLLALALSLDSFGVGIGAALSGIDAGAVAWVAGLATLSFLLIGWELGYRLGKKTGHRLIYLPGLILVGLGLVNLYALF